MYVMFMTDNLLLTEMPFTPLWLRFANHNQYRRITDKHLDRHSSESRNPAIILDPGPRLTTCRGQPAGVTAMFSATC